MPAVDDPFGIAASLPGQLAALKAVVKDLSVNKSGAATSLTIGAGGITDAGALSVTGATTLTGGVTGPVAATGALSGTSLAVGSGAIGGGAITGSSVAVTAAASSATIAVSGNGTVGGTMVVTGQFGSIFAYTNNVSVDVGNRAVWMDNQGNLGYAASSRRFKQNIVTADIDYDTLMKVRVVWFKYIASVEKYGDTAAETHLGAIAEEIHDLGLTWLVDYDDDGQPFELKQERFGFIGILLAKHQGQMIADLQGVVARLLAVNPTA